MSTTLLAPVLLELAADATVQAAVARLQRRGTLRRVAKASVIEARRKDIHITKGSLRLWLRRHDVQQALAVRDMSEDAAAFARLRWLLDQDQGADPDEQTRELLAIVLFQLLSESDPAKATALGTHWLTTRVVGPRDPDPRTR